MPSTHDGHATSRRDTIALTRAAPELFAHDRRVTVLHGDADADPGKINQQDVTLSMTRRGGLILLNDTALSGNPLFA